MAEEFTCNACQQSFPKAWSDAAAVAEAEGTFTAAELATAVVVCDPCLLEMRAAMPDLDARYRASEHGDAS